MVLQVIYHSVILVSEMTYYVSSGTLNSTNSTHSVIGGNLFIKFTMDFISSIVR